ncbi:MAG TPA: hypothetical protein VL126_00485 [Bacteroidota bacterium]|nr:hypothetical protein [Bacteroidota bacterium]
MITRRSKTIFRLSVVMLNFEDGVDVCFARQHVLEKLNDAVLHDGVNPPHGSAHRPSRSSRT